MNEEVTNAMRVHVARLDAWRRAEEIFYRETFRKPKKCNEELMLAAAIVISNFSQDEAKSMLDREDKLVALSNEEHSSEH